MSTIYSHPDGGAISLDDTTLTITAENGHTASILIGPRGLRDVASKFLKIALDFEVAIHLEGLSEKEVLAFDRRVYATAEQADNDAMQKELQRMREEKPLKPQSVRIRMGSQKLASRGELVSRLVDSEFQPSGYTVLRAFSESHWRGIEPGERDMIDLEIEATTACFDPLDAVVVYVQNGVGAKTACDILDVMRRELEGESELLGKSPDQAGCYDFPIPF